MLVTHDRYLLDRVSTTIVGLDGLGSAGRFADYSQWEAWQEEQQRSVKTSAKAVDREPAPANSSSTAGSAKKKLSYLEAREYATLEQRIADAEEQLNAARSAYEDPAISSDAQRLLETQSELERAQQLVNQLYARWEELETKIS